MVKLVVKSNFGLDIFCLFKVYFAKVEQLGHEWLLRDLSTLKYLFHPPELFTITLYSALEN